MPPANDVPQSSEAERAILGAVLLNNAAWEQAAAIDPSEFFLHSHQVLFLTIKTLVDRGSPVDLVLLAEELQSNGALDQVGGARYVSSLTDGLPRLENIGHYVGIVQEKARLRRAIAAGAEITRRAQAGDTAAIAEAAALLTSDNGTEKHQAGPVKIFPTVPDDAWCPTAHSYFEAVRHSTSASPSYHLAVFIAAAGMALGRTCFFRLPKPRFANFFIALVGRAGKAKKGTAMDYGIDLVTAAASNIPWLSSVDSAEGFVDFLAREQRARETKDAPGLLYFSELRGLIEKASREGGRNIIPKLAEAFDCGERIEVGTRNNPLRANRPFVGILGGASPTWLDRLSLQDLEGGIGSRFLWIPSNPKQPYSDPPPLNQPLWNSVIHTLGEMRNYWAGHKESEFTLTPAAKELWEPWFNKLWKLIGNDPLIEVLGERLDLHCRKVAMVYCAIERQEPRIDVAHLQPAIAFTEFLVESLYAIFYDIGLTEAVKQQGLILEHIRESGSGGIRKRALQQKLWRMDAETFNRRLRWMVGEEGSVREEKLNRSTWLYLNE